MEHTWKVKVWGVRGSFPTADSNYLEYGGNTACISAECGERLVVFDAGSGLTALGRQLSRGAQKRIDILLGHMHIDHCLGLFGFKPLHDAGAEIHLYGRGAEGVGLREQLEKLLGPPYWPLGMKNFPAHVEVHEVEPGNLFRLAGSENSAEDLRVRTLAGRHPNGSLLYRLESDHRSIVHALDCETDGEIFDELGHFSQNADLLIWDANFTEEDLSRHRGWGHSSWKQGIALRQAAGAKHVLMTHYSSEYEDNFLQKQEKLAAQMDPVCRFARERMELEI